MSIRKTPVSKIPKKHSADRGFSGSNPFDSDSEHEWNPKPARASSAPPISKGNLKNSHVSYNKDEGMGFPAAKGRYKNDFHDSDSLESQSVQELESYAVYKAEETTQKVSNCLKIAGEIREDAARTLVTLNQQGEQITRTHLTAANIEHDLSRGEKLLGSLGGIFSKTWKPKKNRQIKGPVLTRDDSFIRTSSHIEQKQRLDLVSPRSRSNPRQSPSESVSTLEKVEFEKAKQDDAFTDLSNLLGELKEMAIDMGSEIERQNGALDHLHDDVDELDFRVRGAKQRTQRLLGK